MRMNKKILLLVGSARGLQSTSFSLGNHLLEKLEKIGAECESFLLSKTLKSSDSIGEFLKSIKNADTLILSTPLYVDSLPYLVVRAMEEIAKEYKKNINKKKQNFLCIINSGFPEYEQNDVAVSICRQFSKETGFNWLGGLKLGGGAALDGKPLVKAKGMSKNIIKSLNITADAVIKDDFVPDKAMKLMEKQIVPKRLYLFFGDRVWKKTAKKYGKQNNLYDKPFK
jgi:hypothetical protein